MKKIALIKAIMAERNHISQAEMANLKGGVSANANANGLANANSAVTDDKRRERPGGGVSTQ